MTAVGFLTGRGFGLVVEMGCSVVDCKAAIGSLEARFGLDVISLVVSAAVRPMLAAARARAATAHSENGLGTSFVDGGALDVLAAVIIGGDHCFRDVVAGGAALNEASPPFAASMSIGAFFTPTALSFPLATLITALSTTLPFLIP